MDLDRQTIESIGGEWPSIRIEGGELWQAPERQERLADELGRLLAHGISLGFDISALRLVSVTPDLEGQARLLEVADLDDESPTKAVVWAGEAEKPAGVLLIDEAMAFGLTEANDSARSTVAVGIAIVHRELLALPVGGHPAAPFPDCLAVRELLAYRAWAGHLAGALSGIGIDAPAMQGTSAYIAEVVGKESAGAALAVDSYREDGELDPMWIRVIEAAGPILYRLGLWTGLLATAPEKAEPEGGWKAPLDALDSEWIDLGADLFDVLRGVPIDADPRQTGELARLDDFVDRCLALLEVAAWPAEGGAQIQVFPPNAPVEARVGSARGTRRLREHGPQVHPQVSTALVYLDWNVVNHLFRGHAPGHEETYAVLRARLDDAQAVGDVVVPYSIVHVLEGMRWKDADEQPRLLAFLEQLSRSVYLVLNGDERRPALGPRGVQEVVGDTKDLLGVDFSEGSMKAVGILLRLGVELTEECMVVGGLDDPDTVLTAGTELSGARRREIDALVRGFADTIREVEAAVQSGATDLDQRFGRPITIAESLGRYAEVMGQLGGFQRKASDAVFGGKAGAAPTHLNPLDLPHAIERIDEALRAFGVDEGFEEQWAGALASNPDLAQSPVAGLNAMLGGWGIHRDKTKVSAASSLADGAHLEFARHCDVFVVDDKPFRERTKKNFERLAVECLVLSPAEAVEWLVESRQSAAGTSQSSHETGGF